MSYPGWSKGVRVRRANGDEVRVLDDGEYLPANVPGLVGYLWYYWVRLPDGRTTVIAPEVGDVVVKEERP